MMTKARRAISFTKMHGIGNDFIIVDDFFSGSQTALSAELARKMCDRRFGIGADQILWLKAAVDPALDFRMDILNADGSVAEMCGNGVRAAVLYFHDRVSAQKSHYEVETLAGRIGAEVRDRRITVDMGEPKLLGGFPSSGEKLLIDGTSLSFFEVNMGNPHAVFFTDESIEKFGARIETHPRFPERTNVEFVKVEGPQTIRVQVWERGAGITLACGTGACASAVAALVTRRVSSPVTVRLPGGELTIHYSDAVNRFQRRPVLMEGPAAEVFSGQYWIED
jgi:diaminopimelate epimerase